MDLTGEAAYDPDAARELLAGTALADRKLSLKLPPPSYARRGGEIVAAALRDVGIDVEIEPVEWSQWLEQVFTNRDYDLTIVSHTEPNDIGIYARPDYYFGYSSEEFDTVLAKLDTEANTEARYELMREAQRILSRDSVNAFLFQLAKVGIADAKIEGLWENSPVQANDLTEVRWND